MYWRLDNYAIYYCLIAQTLKYVFIISCYLVNVNIQLIKYRNASLLATVICMRRNNKCGAPGSSLPKGEPWARTSPRVALGWLSGGRAAASTVSTKRPFLPQSSSQALQSSPSLLDVMGSLSELKPWLCLVPLKQR